MTQNNAILDHLKSGRRITPLEALDLYGCLRLGARIYELRRAGHNIKASRVGDGKKSWAEYRLDEIAVPRVGGWPAYK